MKPLSPPGNEKKERERFFIGGENEPAERLVGKGRVSGGLSNRREQKGCGVHVRGGVALGKKIDKHDDYFLERGSWNSSGVLQGVRQKGRARKGAKGEPMRCLSRT